MAYVRQTKQDKIKKAILIAIPVLILISTGIWIAVTKNWEVKENKAAANEGIVLKDSGKVNVVRASRAITAGESADATKFELIAVPRELAPEAAVTSMQQLQERRVANTMEEKEFLMRKDLIESTQWYGDGDRLVEQTFQEGAVPSTVEVGSVVDIKLFKSKELDPVVVAKAAVVGKIDRTLSFYLSEEEQENIKEANTEGLLFLVQYLDKAQTASSISYKPSYKASGGFADNSKSKNTEGGRE